MINLLFETEEFMTGFDRTKQKRIANGYKDEHRQTGFQAIRINRFTGGWVGSRVENERWTNGITEIQLQKPERQSESRTSSKNAVKDGYLVCGRHGGHRTYWTIQTDFHYWGGGGSPDVTGYCIQIVSRIDNRIPLRNPFNRGSICVFQIAFVIVTMKKFGRLRLVAKNRFLWRLTTGRRFEKIRQPSP